MRLPAFVAVLALAVPAAAVRPVAEGEQADLHRQLPTGAPSPELVRTPSRQLVLSNSPRLHALAARWGKAWAWRFDERTGRPYSAALPGVPWSQADALAEDLRTTLGPVTLEPLAEHRVGDTRVRSWRQLHDGVPMWGTELAVFARAGRIHAVRTAVDTPPSASAPADAELWWPLALADEPGKGWAPATWHEADEIVTVRHVDGSVLARWTTRHYATVEVGYEERTVGDSVLVGPFTDVTVTDASTSEVTDAEGKHARTDPYDLRMEGVRLRMRDGYVGFATPEWTDLEGDVSIAFTDDIDPAAADTWVHTKIVEAWLEDREPDHALLDEQVVASVNIASRCNAYYTSGTVNFFRAGGSCANTGRLADVVYHEYGHGVHHYGALSGGFAGDLSEGFADYVSATLTDDPGIGLGFYGGTSTIRNIEPDKKWPDDVRGQVHADGLIWASFLWNLREAWIQDYGEETGVRMVDELALGAMSYGPFMTTVGDAVILADDDDGDLSNGTPHGCDLITLLDQHGLAPGPIGVVTLNHDPIDEAGSYDPGYPVDFAVYDATPDCTGLDRDSIALWWTTDPVGPADASDPFQLVPDGSGDDPNAVEVFTSAGGATWQRLELSEEADGVTFTGTIPRQLATETVSYFIEARSLEENERISTHEGQSDRVYRFRIGDRERVSCEGFESELTWEHGAGTPWQAPSPSWVDQWSAGEAVPALFSPDASYDGLRMVGTAIGESYRNNNLQYLRSPAWTVPDGRMQMLSFRRWLTVEDALYDKARIYLNDDRVWEQTSTAGGGNHTLDTRWVLQELDVGDRAGEDVRLTWTLGSDPGLEYGGWHLDDVCVVRLDDLPGHHRIRDLRAEPTDTGIALTWSNPWIAPLDEIVVVRRLGEDPTSLEDGAWVALLVDPEPTAAVSFEDDEVAPCGRYHYAAFVKGDGVWYDAVVTGENTASAATDCPDPEETELPDPVDPTPDGLRGEVDGYQLPELPAGCSCDSGTSGATPLALLGLLALFRRRRRTG